MVFVKPDSSAFHIGPGNFRRLHLFDFLSTRRINESTKNRANFDWGELRQRLESTFLRIAVGRLASLLGFVKFAD